MQKNQELKNVGYGVMNVSDKDIKLKDKTSIRAEEERRDDFLANRMLIIMIAATVLIVAMLLAKKNDINFEAKLIINALGAIRIVTGALFAASLVYFIVNLKRGVDESYKYFSSRILLCTSGVLFAMALLFTKIQTTGSVVLLIGVVVLYFLFCFYPRDFFFFSVMTCAGASLVYLSSFAIGASLSSNIIKIAGRAVAIILPAAVIIFVLILRKNLGSMSIGGKKVRVMRPDYLYYPFVVCGGITIVGAALAMLVPVTMVYSVIALFAAFLVIAIVYTIRMM